MKIIQKSAEMHNISSALCRDRNQIGFVPTMGFLHEGHLSLVTKARQDSDIVVVSIFVNPTQFGPGEDLDKYPRDFEGDIKKLSSAGVDLLFSPSLPEIYCEDHSTIIHTGDIEKHLCGQSRPHHFSGVATVVAKLFNLVHPTRAYFGQKDYQQCLILKKMVKELNFAVDIVICPIVRESDGLAASSRNIYLNEEQRKSATILYRALKEGENLIIQGWEDSDNVKNEMRKFINSEKETHIEYAAVVDPESLEDLRLIRKPVLLALAVHIGNTRLIDNLLIN